MVQAESNRLYIFRFLHQTTTFWNVSLAIASCISFVSYIKPQLFATEFNNIPVVYLSFPTSNHNLRCKDNKLFVLYIFRFLHQTTTNLSVLYCMFCCISFVSYIKPQQLAYPCCKDGVVYLSFPTSNHNTQPLASAPMVLYIFRFLHQTTTLHLFLLAVCGCISFVSYIKPQLCPFPLVASAVVYLSFPTSNHNASCESGADMVLYIFRFLHQTTTVFCFL